MKEYRLSNNLFLNGHRLEDAVKEELKHCPNLMEFLRELMAYKIEKGDVAAENWEDMDSHKIASYIGGRAVCRSMLKMFEEVDQTDE